MVFDPEARKIYDRNRYAKLKADYIAKNPNYKPAREQQKEKREATKMNDRQTQQVTGGFGSLMSVYDVPQQRPSIVKRSAVRLIHKNNDIEADDDEVKNSIQRQKRAPPTPTFEPIFFY